MMIYRLLFIFLFSYLSIFSAEPLIKFYMQDGSTRQYNISDIQDIGRIKSNNSAILAVHIKSFSNPVYYVLHSISKIDFSNNQINFNFKDSIRKYNLIDIDSIIINPESVKICNQIWMRKNLDVDHYRNGDPIPEVRDASEWANLTTGAWCYYNNDSANELIYGKLYNWYAVNDPRGLAPEGWHVPTDAEWKELEMCLGMTQTQADKTGFRGTDEGGKLKSTGTKEAGDGLWLSPNTGATNESGFSALPGGIRYNDGAFYDVGSIGDWWSSTEGGATYAWGRYLGYSIANVSRYNGSKGNGYSVRCVKD